MRLRDDAHARRPGRRRRRRGSRPASAGSAGRRGALALGRARRVVAQDLDVALRVASAVLGQPARAGSSSSRSPGRRSTSARCSSPSSRSSGLVNAACAGPRRPSMTTSLDLRRRASASIAWSAVSVAASSSGSSTSIRATSIATLPLPITTARLRGEVELVVGGVGVAVVPGDELGGRVRAGPVLAGDAEPVVVRRADRVETAW